MYFLTLNVDVVTRTYCISIGYYLAVLSRGLRLADALFCRVSTLAVLCYCVASTVKVVLKTKVVV